MATTRLGESSDLLRLDLRGHGGSVWRGRLGLGVWCDDLGELLAAESAGPAVLVGHCLGANVALHFAGRRPEMVAGLVLVEPMLREALTGRLRWLARLDPAVGPLLAVIRALNALGLRRRRLRPLDLAELDRDTRALLAAPGGERALARYASPRLDLATTPTAAWLAGLRAVTRPVPDLATITAPVLALLSTGGAFGDPRQTERRLRALPCLSLVHLESRHWIPTERPEEMRRAIEQWRDTIGRRP